MTLNPELPLSHAIDVTHAQTYFVSLTIILVVVITLAQTKKLTARVCFYLSLITAAIW